MDNTVREFLLLVKKLLAELRTLNFNFLRFQETVESISEEQQTQNMGAPPSPEMAAILNTLQAIHTEQATGNRSQDTHEKRNAWIGGTGVFVLLAYTLVNWGMLRAMKEANKAASDSFAKTLCQMRVQTRAQQDAATASGNSAKAMGDQVTEFRNSTYYTLRPYVSVVSVDIVGGLKEGQKFKGVAQIVNSGKTPAIHAQGCADVALLPNNTVMTDDFPCPAPNNPKGTGRNEISKFTIGAGAPFPLSSPGTTISPVDQLLRLLDSGALRLYFYGDLSYGDILERKAVHHMTFCARYNTITKTLEVCEKHNWMD
jgi:hypothetical protein